MLFEKDSIAPPAHPSVFSLRGSEGGLGRRDDLDLKQPRFVEEAANDDGERPRTRAHDLGANGAIFDRVLRSERNVVALTTLSSVMPTSTSCASMFLQMSRLCSAKEPGTAPARVTGTWPLKYAKACRAADLDDLRMADGGLRSVGGVVRCNFHT